MPSLHREQLCRMLFLAESEVKQTLDNLALWSAAHGGTCAASGRPEKDAEQQLSAGFHAAPGAKCTGHCGCCLLSSTLFSQDEPRNSGVLVLEESLCRRKPSPMTP